MKSIGTWSIVGLGLFVVAACRSGDTSRGEPPSASSAAPLSADSTVVLIADMSEAEDDCGCGVIIRDVRAATQKGVPAKEIDTRTSKDEAKKYRVSVVPAVLFLDASGKELRRYEGESDETIKRMKTDLDTLASSKK